MNQNTLWQKFFWLLLLGSLLIFIGCGGGAPTSRAPSTTDLLVQSGFQAEGVKSPDHLQKLPGNKFVTVQGQKGTTYVYTDPNSKQLYFGDETAFQRFKTRASQAAKTIASQPPAFASHNMSSMDWAMYASLQGVGP